MQKEFEGSGSDGSKIKILRGWTKEFEYLYEINLLHADNKSIYNALLEKTIRKNGSLIPSRNEKRNRGVKWKVAWRNLSLLRSLDPHEKCFGWKMTQDLVEVGARLHRKGANKQCSKVNDGRICNHIETLEHRLFLCDSMKLMSQATKGVIEWLIGKSVDRKEIVYLNLTHRKKTTLLLCLWFTIKAMVLIFDGKTRSKNLLLSEISKEICWNISQKVVIGSRMEMKILAEYLNNISS